MVFTVSNSMVHHGSIGIVAELGGAAGARPPMTRRGKKKSWFRFDSVANNLQLAWRFPLDLHRVELAQNILDR
jgi:hypothetical protein